MSKPGPEVMVSKDIPDMQEMFKALFGSKSNGKIYNHKFKAYPNLARGVRVPKPTAMSFEVNPDGIITVHNSYRPEDFDSFEEFEWYVADLINSLNEEGDQNE